MRYHDPRLGELLAAEYVLGTLQGQARRRFEGLVQAHPDLRRRVRDWERRLNRLAWAAAPATLPAGLWQAVERRLFAEPARAPRWERLAFWRALALGSTALAGLLMVLLMMLPALRQAPGYVVVIHDNASHELVWMASTSADMAKFYIKNTKPMDMPGDNRCLLWLQPRGSQQVYALGVLPARGGDMLLPVDEKMRALLPGRLLVTVEQAGADLPQHPSGPARFVGEWMPVKGI